MEPGPEEPQVGPIGMGEQRFVDHDLGAVEVDRHPDVVGQAEQVEGGFGGVGGGDAVGGDGPPDGGTHLSGFRTALTHVDARFVEGPTPDADGQRIPGRVPTRFETRLTLERSPFAAEVDFTWADALPVDDAGLATAPSWFRTDVRLGLEPVRTGTTVITPWLEIGNVFDVHHVGSVAVNAFGGRYFEPAPGRTLSAGMQVELGW